MPMNTLFLDFSSHHKSLALVAGKKVELKTIENHIDEAALPKLIESFGEFDRILATTGPGGFMSLRVGLSWANTLAWAKKIPLAGLHLSGLWAARATHEPLTTDHSFLWIHSTKKEFLFIRGFGDFSKQWPEPTLIALKDLQTALSANRYSLPAPFIGELIPEQAKVLSLKPMEKLRPLEDVLPDLCANATYGSESLLPWYGRGA